MASEQAAAASSYFLEVKAVLPSFFQSSADFQISIFNYIKEIKTTTIKSQRQFQNVLFANQTPPLSQTSPPSSLIISAFPLTSFIGNIPITFCQIQIALKIFDNGWKKLNYMTKQFLTINKQFLDQNNYEQASRNSRSLNIKYGQLCELFRKEFQALANDRTQLSSVDQTRRLQGDRKKHKFQFIEELKVFIRDFLSILRDRSDYQVNCLEGLRDNNQPNLDITSRIISKVKNNKELSEQIDEKKNVLIQTYSQIKKSYHSFQQQSKNPVLYYQAKFIQGQQSQLKQKMTKDWKIMSEILAKREECEGKLDEFEPYLSTYRKRLINNKYEVLKKLVYLTRNIKVAIIEIFGTLRNCSIDKRKDYLKVIESSGDDINYLKDYFEQANQPSFLEHYTEQNRNWEKFTSRSITDFEETFEEIEHIVSQLISFFNNFCNKCNEMHDSFRTLTNEISEFFPEAESPYALMKELSEVQLHFGKKMGKIVLRLQEIQSKLRLQKNNCKKQAQILLTIIKVNKNNYRSFMENFNKNNELQQLISKISFQPTKVNIIALYDEFIDLHNELLSKFDSHPRRPTYDSMEISHTLPEMKVPDKRIPLKQEYWLWREYKSEIEINFQFINQYFKDIQDSFDKIISTSIAKESTTLEQHKAILIQEEEIEGLLQLKINSLQFSTSHLKISIPWKEVLSVKVINKVWKDILVVETSKGPLQFYKIVNIESVMNEIKETQEKSSMSKKKKIDRKPEPQLSEEELAVIAERKVKIQKELPDLKEFRVVAEETFQNYRIDQIYELFYSDKIFSFYGKEDPCFFSYTGKKAGNYNWVAEQYDKPGPQFYTGKPEVTFKNCPLFSTRKISYNHPMKPSSIPFMPKFCLNTDHRKMYWISHEEFLYMIDSITEGVPYADCFTVALAHSVKVEGKGIKVSISMHINWKESTMMKSTIEGNVNPEVKENMVNFISEIGKVLKLMTSLEKGEEVEIPQELGAEEKTMDKPPDEVSKLKLHNKILIIAFIALILLNLIFAVGRD